MDGCIGELDGLNAKPCHNPTESEQQEHEQQPTTAEPQKDPGNNSDWYLESPLDDTNKITILFFGWIIEIEIVNGLNWIGLVMWDGLDENHGQ